jgi:hypothetical protein
MASPKLIPVAYPKSAVSRTAAPVLELRPLRASGLRLAKQADDRASTRPRSATEQRQVQPRRVPGPDESSKDPADHS